MNYKNKSNFEVSHVSFMEYNGIFFSHRSVFVILHMNVYCLG